MKRKFKINPITDNYLDKSLQKVLFPFRFLQHMLFLSRYSIEYNCIRPHSTSYYIISLIGTLVLIIFHLEKYTSNDFDDVTNDIVIFFLKFNAILLVIPFICFYFLNIFQREDHVRIILKIQKGFQLVNHKEYKKAIHRSWFGIFRHVAFFVASVFVIRDFVIIVYLYTLVYFDVHITYAFILISLIRDGMISWISEVEHYSKLSTEYGDDYNDEFQKLFQAYSRFMEAFEIFKKIFKYAVRGIFCCVCFILN